MVVGEAGEAGPATLTAPFAFGCLAPALGRGALSRAGLTGARLFARYGHHFWNSIYRALKWVGIISNFRIKCRAPVLPVLYLPLPALLTLQGNDCHN